MAKRAVKEYFKLLNKDEDQLMVEYGDKGQPLLNKGSGSSDEEEDEESDDDEEQNERYKKLPKQLAIGN